MAIETQQLEKLDSVTEQFSGVLTESNMEAQKTALANLTQQQEEKDKTESKENIASTVPLDQQLILMDGMEQVVIHRPNLNEWAGTVRFKVVETKGSRVVMQGEVSANVRPELLEFIKSSGNFEATQEADAASRKKNITFDKIENNPIIIKGEVVPRDIVYVIYGDPTLLKNPDWSPFVGDSERDDNSVATRVRDNNDNLSSSTINFDDKKEELWKLWTGETGYSEVDGKIIYIDKGILNGIAKDDSLTAAMKNDAIKRIWTQYQKDHEANQQKIAVEKKAEKYKKWFESALLPKTK